MIEWSLKPSRVPSGVRTGKPPNLCALNPLNYPTQDIDYIIIKIELNPAQIRGNIVGFS